MAVHDHGIICTRNGCYFYISAPLEYTFLIVLKIFFSLFTAELLQASLVEDPSGGVLLIGGMLKDTQTASEAMYRLEHAADDWIVLHSTLKYPRFNHSAFFVPSSVAKCV
jgi:hypothetical protein